MQRAVPIAKNFASEYKVSVIGDSLVKLLPNHHGSEVLSFPGRCVTEIMHTVQFSKVATESDVLVIHGGANDISNFKDPQYIVDDILAMASKAKFLNPNVKIFISGQLPRGEDLYGGVKPREVRCQNDISKTVNLECSTKSEFIYLDHYFKFLDQNSNILPNLFARDGHHLLPEGSDVLYSSIIYQLTFHLTRSRQTLKSRPIALSSPPNLESVEDFPALPAPILPTHLHFTTPVNTSYKPKVTNKKVQMNKLKSTTQRSKTKYRYNIHKTNISTSSTSITESNTSYFTERECLHATCKWSECRAESHIISTSNPFAILTESPTPDTYISHRSNRSRGARRNQTHKRKSKPSRRHKHKKSCAPSEPSTTGTDISPNTTRTDISPNTTGTDISTNTTGTDISPNTSGTHVSTNTTCTVISPNTTGTDIPSNTTGTDISPNTTGNDIPSNTTGTDISPNTTGTDILPNTTGTDISPNTTGTDIPSDTTGTGISPNPTGTDTFPFRVKVGLMCIDLSLSKNTYFARDLISLIKDYIFLNTDCRDFDLTKMAYLRVEWGKCFR
ncbi:unnamed protein product, partial [Owenia fusiformis]